MREDVVRFHARQLTLKQFTAHALAELFFKFAKVPRQRVNTQGVFEVPCFALGEVLNQVLQVDQPIVDGRGCEHEH